MNISIENDIPYEVARRAYLGTSFSPEKRANTVIEEYKTTIKNLYSKFQSKCDTNEKKETLDRLFSYYHGKLKNLYLDWLSKKSRCMSPMIAGPARFPVARNQKNNDYEHAAAVKFSDYLKYAEDKINKELHPELAPIMAGDDDAVSRLEEKIKTLEERQNFFKETNKILRKKINSEEKEKLIIEKFGKITDSQRELILSNSSIERFYLTNNNANLRTAKKRLEKIKANKSQKADSLKGKNADVEINPSDNRVRLIFSGKPDYEVRKKLKSNGFRWSPRNTAWQAYMNVRSIAFAKEFAEVA